MGIFSKLSGSSPDIEKQLEAIYVPRFQETAGMTLTQAKSTFRDLIKKAKEDSLSEGTSKWPQNFGDILLKEEFTNPHYKSFLAKRRRQGARDEDIRWWFNMYDLERRMIIQEDNLSCFALFLKLKEDGISKEEAGKRVKKSHPIFGDPDNTSTSTGKDRPLTWELKDRINNYIQKRFKTKTDTLKFLNELEKSSSFNALVRKEIKNGKI